MTDAEVQRLRERPVVSWIDWPKRAFTPASALGPGVRKDLATIPAMSTAGGFFADYEGVYRTAAGTIVVAGKQDASDLKVLKISLLAEELIYVAEIVQRGNLYAHICPALLYFNPSVLTLRDVFIDRQNHLERHWPNGYPDRCYFADRWEVFRPYHGRLALEWVAGAVSALQRQHVATYWTEVTA